MDESALRCPHCGELADGDTDELLARMRASVTRCRDELSSPQAVIAADEERERATMLSELEQLRGEVHMLRGELEQLRSAQRALVLQAAQASPVVYTQPYEAESRARFRPFYKRIAPPRKKGRSRNRMVIASLSLALLAWSIVCFFLPWVNGETSFTGFGALAYLFGFSDGAGAAYSVYLSEVVGIHVFSANETVSNLCRAICSNLLLYGTPLYAASLLLGLPLAASRVAGVRVVGAPVRHDQLGERLCGRLRLVPRGRHRRLPARRFAHLLPRQVGVLGRPAQLIAKAPDRGRCPHRPSGRPAGRDVCFGYRFLCRRATQGRAPVFCLPSKRAAFLRYKKESALLRGEGTPLRKDGALFCKKAGRGA